MTLLSRRFQRYCISGCIALGSLAVGIAPSLEATPRVFVWQQQAIAQSSSSFTPDQIKRYAQAYLLIYGGNDMEELLQEVQGLIGKKPDWEIMCDNPQSINRLENRQAIAKVSNYCNNILPSRISGIISPSDFNKMTKEVTSNAALRQQVQSAMVDILKSDQ